jgi:hypothetical protein
MKEHTQKNARIPPADLCSDAPSLSAQPPPLRADSGFTAFHSARNPASRAAATGCIAFECADNRCALGGWPCLTGCRSTDGRYPTEWEVRQMSRSRCAPELSPTLVGEVSP